MAKPCNSGVNFSTRLKTERGREGKKGGGRGGAEEKAGQRENLQQKKREKMTIILKCQYHNTTLL